MRIIVTGSSGLLGRHVAAALVEAGHSVMGIDAPFRPRASAGSTSTADLTELGQALQLVRDADAVVHIAAIPRPTGRPAGHVFQTNMAACYNVVEAAVCMAPALRLCLLLQRARLSLFRDARGSALSASRFQRTRSARRMPMPCRNGWVRRSWMRPSGAGPASPPSACACPGSRPPRLSTRRRRTRRRRAALVARDLWAYLDARDAAAAFVAAVERPFDGHHRVFLSAADTFMEIGDRRPGARPPIPVRRDAVGASRA